MNSITTPRVKFLPGRQNSLAGLVNIRAFNERIRDRNYTKLKEQNKHLINILTEQAKSADSNPMDTIEDMKAMPEEKRKQYIRYEGWSPYCLMCNYGGRMLPTIFGFQCPQCKNMIGHHLERLVESPMNQPDYHVKGMYAR